MQRRIFNLNTTFVSLQLAKANSFFDSNNYLNTTFVSLQQKDRENESNISANLNTTFVSLQHKQVTRLNKECKKFKYNFCFSSTN